MENGTGVVHSTVTTSNGEFAFQDLPLGEYRVTVTVKGFQQTNVQNVTVTAGSVYTVPVKLTMGRETTAVEVSAAALQVDTTTSTQIDTITDTALQNIPLNGRDWTQLATLETGVVIQVPLFVEQGQRIRVDTRSGDYVARA